MRIVLISNVRPIAERLIPFLRELGHEPVAAIAQRPSEEKALNSAATGLMPYSNSGAPWGIDLVFLADKSRLAPTLRLYEPDVTLCWGFGWKIPQEALDVARLGSVNQSLSDL